MLKRTSTRFMVRLAGVHAKSGKTVYRVAKDLGMSYNTVRKYVLTDVECELIPPEVMRLAAYYGLTWEQAVSIIEEADVDADITPPVDEDPQIKNLLAVPA